MRNKDLGKYQKVALPVVASFKPHPRLRKCRRVNGGFGLPEASWNISSENKRNKTPNIAILRPVKASLVRMLGVDPWTGLATTYQ